MLLSRLPEKVLVLASDISVEYGLMVQCSMLAGQEAKAAADAGQSIEIITQSLSLFSTHHAFRQHDPVLGCCGDISHSSDDDDDGPLSCGGRSNSSAVRHQSEQ